MRLYLKTTLIFQAFQILYSNVYVHNVGRGNNAIVLVSRYYQGRNSLDAFSNHLDEDISHRRH